MKNSIPPFKQKDGLLCVILKPVQMLTKTLGSEVAPSLGR